MGETTMNKPIMITRSAMPPMEEYIEKMKELWDSRYLTNSGKFHKEFEEALIKYLNVSNVSLFTNGHMGLELTLEAMNLSGEVITTPFTFASTTQAIVRNNLTPVFCDVKEDDYTIDESKIEELITDKTCAIVPVYDQYAQKNQYTLVNTEKISQDEAERTSNDQPYLYILQNNVL